jgi:hypothetical protein
MVFGHDELVITLACRAHAERRSPRRRKPLHVTEFRISPTGD